MEEMARELDWAAANATRRAAREARAVVYRQARTLMIDVEALAQSFREAAELHVRARPWEMIGLAVTAGVIIGLLLGRREPSTLGSTPSPRRQP